MNSARDPRRSLVLLPLLLVSSALVEEPGGQLLRHWDYPRTPLDVKVAGVEERGGGVRVQDLSYASALGVATSLGPGSGRVPAYLVVPPGKGPFPAVIYAHWCMPGSEMKGRKEFLEEAVVLARSGVVSLLPDHVEVRGGFVEATTPLDTQQIDVLVHEITDLRRGADLLLARTDVDPKRLAFVGHSCGGEAGALLSGIDRRFKAFVVMAGGAADSLVFETKRFQEYRKKVGAEKFDAFNARYSWTDAGKYISHAAPAFVFMQYATDEPLVVPEIAKRYHAMVSGPKRLKIYEAPHALNPEATRDRLAFLAEQLGVPPPDPKAVASIPALVQPPWPKRAE